MVQLSDDLVAELDEVAANQGVSRSALIRRALADYLTEVRASDVGRRIVEGYRAIPPETPDAWGDVAAADTGTRELLQRLDAEERAAGHAPW